jgi:hypothetical protein
VRQQRRRRQSHVSYSVPKYELLMARLLLKNFESATGY